MARILALSSFVAAGHVGLSAAAPVLTLLGHDMIQIPTVVLSNHPGFAHVGGRAVPPDQIASMIDALSGLGWLAEVDAVLTGYMPSAEHVGQALRAVELSGAPLICDPVLGDAPKGLYVAEAAALAIRAGLVPRAAVLTPNLFELGWLAGREVSDRAAAVAAAREIAPGRRVILTSPPFGLETGLLDIHPDGDTAYRVSRRDGVPHGTGDVLSALIAAGEAPGAALGRLDALIAASLGRPHLALQPAGWLSAAPIAPAD